MWEKNWQITPKGSLWSHAYIYSSDTYILIKNYNNNNNNNCGWCILKSQSNLSYSQPKDGAVFDIWWRQDKPQQRINLSNVKRYGREIEENQNKEKIDIKMEENVFLEKKKNEKPKHKLNKMTKEWNL